jgi:hypothetical protein
MASESDISSNEKMMRALALINPLLGGLSATERKTVLAMASAPYFLRVIPMDRPIGNPQARPAPVVAQQPETGSGKSANKPAAWKQDERWVSAIAERKRLVTELKSDSSPTNAQALRSHEESMRLLKQSLRGFGN